MYSKEPEPRNLLSAVIGNIFRANWGREETMRMVNILASQSGIGISPDLQIPPCKLLRHQGIELQSRSQSSPHFFEVLDLKDGRRGAIELEHLDGRFKDMLAGDTDFLSL